MTRVSALEADVVMVPIDVLSEEKLAQKIEKVQSRIKNLEERLCFRNTHGGSRYRRRQISLKEQIFRAKGELAELEKTHRVFENKIEKQGPKEDFFSFSVFRNVGNYLLGLES